MKRRQLKPRDPILEDTEEELIAHAELRSEDLAREDTESERTEPNIDSDLARRLANRRRHSPLRRKLAALQGQLKIALRAIWREPTYSATVVGTLSLSIAAAVAMFAVINSVLLAPLRYENPERLVVLWSFEPTTGAEFSPSYPDFVDWQASATNASSMAFIRGHAMSLESPDGTQRLTAAAVTPDFNQTLGARAALGSLRGFGSAGEPAVVLKHSTWVGRFGSDPDILDRTIVLDGRSYRVAAVLEQGANYPLWAHVWVPLDDTMIARLGLNRRDYRLDNRVIARLADGASADQLRASLVAVAEGLGEIHPQSNRDISVATTPLEQMILGDDTNDSLGFLMAGVLVMVLIACVNVAMLTLVRGASRVREMAMRKALGASRTTLVSQMLVESFSIALIAGSLGIALAHLTLEWFTSRGIPGLPRVDEIAISTESTLFALALSFAVALAFGIVPAIRAGSADISRSLRGKNSTAGATLGRSALVVLQIGLAITLVSSAGALTVSLHRLSTVDPGFDPDGLYTLRIEPPANMRDQPQERRQLYDRLVESAEAIPGVTGASVVSHAPLSGTSVVTPVVVASDERGRSATLRIADTDYFQFMGIDLLNGRPSAGTAEFVVNEAFASAVYDGSAVGESITVFRQASSDPDYGSPITGTIVGVAANTLRAVRADLTEPIVYVHPDAHTWTSSYLLVRSTLAGEAAVDRIRSAVASVDPSLPRRDVNTLRQLASFGFGRDRFMATLATVLSVAAGVLAAAGLMGLLTYQFQGRRREIAVRMAVGATSRSVLRLITSSTMRLLVAGIVLGCIGAAMASRLIEATLFNTSPYDPRALGIALVSVLLLGTIATVRPAISAIRTNPVELLRSD